MTEVVNWISVIIEVLSGLVVCIPLLVKLVETVKALIKEKNWAILVQNVYKLMGEAEELYERGADKKDYVMSAIEFIALQINYDYNAEAKAKVSAMIDETCSLAKELVKIDK